MRPGNFFFFVTSSPYEYYSRYGCGSFSRGGKERTKYRGKLLVGQIKADVQILEDILSASDFTAAVL